MRRVRWIQCAHHIYVDIRTLYYSRHQSYIPSLAQSAAPSTPSTPACKVIVSASISWSLQRHSATARIACRQGRQGRIGGGKVICMCTAVYESMHSQCLSTAGCIYLQIPIYASRQTYIHDRRTQPVSCRQKQQYHQQLALHPACIQCHALHTVPLTARLPSAGWRDLKLF